MSTAAAATAPIYPWREHLFGDGVSTRQSVLVLASYPILLVLVILSAFVRYMWAALAMYCAFLFVFSCAARAVVDRRAAVARAGRPGLGGLSAAAIAAVAPAFLYDAEEGEAECPVCLEAVKDGEKARRLPACAHAFHVACIDMWLDSHATCPVCRCHVLPKIKAVKELPDDTSSAQAPTAEPPLPPV
ncbi:hypothetical protein PR202_gb27603 [Eleusine coracana subsp. coracana]|uniref:RING-type E3 ubiquitin transferase n=1 Tax=Eleusine coracana subsp. coracana TaxID=191504 RepID=A0AAV5FS85_ELECO|nr:hypothetical protein PR202_gb27603 [Eleusine coracana subsp. coracana]